MVGSGERRGILASRAFRPRLPIPAFLTSLDPDSPSSLARRPTDLLVVAALLALTALPDAMVVPLLEELLVVRYGVGPGAAHAFLSVNLIGGLCAVPLLGLVELELQRARAGFQERLDGGDLFSAADVAKAQARLADVALARDEDEAARDLLKQALALDAGRAAVWFKLYQVALALDDQELVALAKRKYEQLSPNTESVAPMGSGMGTGQ